MALRCGSTIFSFGFYADHEISDPDATNSRVSSSTSFPTPQAEPPPDLSVCLVYALGLLVARFLALIPDWFPTQTC